MNKLILLFLISLIGFSCNKNDDPKPDESGLFVKFFGGAFDDNGFSVASAEDGGYYLAGSTINAARLDTNVLIVKIDQYGNKEWERSYTLGNYGEVARDLKVDQDGNVVVAGYKKNKHGFTDLMLLRISKDNPDAFEEFVFGDSMVNERGYNLVQAADGAFIVYGSSLTAGTLDMYFLKTNLTDTVWQRQIGVNSSDDNIGSLSIRNDGKLLWCGSVERIDGMNMRLVFADDFGNLMWDYGFEENDGIYQYGYSMDVLDDGGYIIAGSRNRSPGANSVKDIYLVRTNSNGIQEDSYKNEIVLEGAGSQEAFSVLAIENNQFVICGYKSDDNGHKDIYVAKIDENGNILFSNSFGGVGDDIGNKILKTSTGYIIIGTIEAGNNKMMGVYKINEELKLAPEK